MWLSVKVSWEGFKPSLHGGVQALRNGEGDGVSHGRVMALATRTQAAQVCACECAAARVFGCKRDLVDGCERAWARK